MQRLYDSIYTRVTKIPVRISGEGSLAASNRELTENEAAQVASDILELDSELGQECSELYRQ